jgi:hypothetical protein
MPVLWGAGRVTAGNNAGEKPVGCELADWRSWGRALGVPLLVEGADGRLREPFERVAGLGTGVPVRRRRRRSPLHSRRASLPLRRRHVPMLLARTIHLGECEIIARN